MKRVSIMVMIAVNIVLIILIVIMSTDKKYPCKFKSKVVYDTLYVPISKNDTTYLTKDKFVVKYITVTIDTITRRIINDTLYTSSNELRSYKKVFYPRQSNITFDTKSNITFDTIRCWR
jgi:hypothetical protein